MRRWRCPQPLQYSAILGALLVTNGTRSRDLTLNLAGGCVGAPFGAPVTGRHGGAPIKPA